MILPMVQREMRAEARRPANYWVRVLAGAAVLAVCWSGASRDGILPSHLGPMLFGTLNGIIFGAIWVLVPLLAADCLSAEKREGTLGLLFLTPLKSIDIVLGKFCMHFVRAFTIFLAMTPVLAVPILMGGISERELGLALMLDTASLLLALSAGLLASAYCRERVRALVLAEVLAVFLAYFFVMAFAHRATSAYAASAPVWTIWYGEDNWLLGDRLGHALRFTTGWGGDWNQFSVVLANVVAMSSGGYGWSGAAVPAVLPQADLGLLRQAVSLLMVATVVLGAVLWVVIVQTRRSMLEREPGPLQRWWRKKWLRPVDDLQPFFQNRMRKKLARNPIAWLQQYSWTSRCIKWGWLAVIVLLEMYFINDGDAFRLLAFFLLAGIVFGSVSSFHKEAQTGALELILVTPVRERQIITGRVYGVWWQFLPALALVVWVQYFMSGHWPSLIHERYAADEGRYAGLAALVSFYLTLPVIGLYFASLRLNLFVAVLGTLVVGVIVPLFLPEMLYPFSPYYFDMSDWKGLRVFETFVTPMVSVGSALFCGWRLWRRLRWRTFKM